MANISKPTVAAFDFDGTLTYRDSLLPFLHFVSGTRATIINIFWEIPHLIKYLLGYLDRQGLKEAFLTRFFKGKTQQDMQAYAELFTVKSVS